MNVIPRRAVQRHRVNRVLNFAYEHLAETLNLDQLADVACLSKFHFTRVFTAHLGETPLQYLWRIRLERAARNLIYLPDRSITEVAFDSGFSSAQTFCKSFQSRFQMSARSFRADNHVNSQDRSRKDAENTRLQWPIVRAPDETCGAPAVRIVFKREYRVAYIRHLGPYYGQKCRITTTFRWLENWARSRGLWHEGSVGIGLCPDHSAFTPPDRCLYDAGMLVPEGIGEDEVVSIQTVPAGLYAVLKVKCEAPRMDNIWEWFTSVWLPASGQSREFLPCYELYTAEQGKPFGPENGVELCLRLKPP